jgi:hypothetical protein
MENMRNKTEARGRCPVCGLHTSKSVAAKNADLPPIGYILRQHLKRQRSRKPAGRDWRTDPWPGDYVAILDRAYYERPNPRNDIQVPVFRHVVRVSENRVYYRVRDDARVRSCSLATWRRLDADLFGAAVNPPNA